MCTNLIPYTFTHMKKASKTEVYNFRMTPAMRISLDKIRDTDKRSINQIIELAIEQYVNKKK